MGLLSDLISKVGVDTRDFQKGLDNAERKLIRSGRRMSLMGNDLMRNVSLPIVAMGGFALKSAADIERLELALKNAMGGGYLEELEKLKQAAKDPGLGFEQAIRGSVMLQSVGENAENARYMMQQWGNAVAAAGGTAADLDRVMVQLQQALSKQGALLREDWKFIVQQAPQAQKAMMDLYGTGSTEQLAKQGVTAKQAIQEITNELAKLERVQGGMANAFKNFTDELKQALVPLGKAIFESANFRETMTGVIAVITRASEWFAGLSTGVQQFIVLSGLGVAAMGPFIRTMGSMLLLYAPIAKNLSMVRFGLSEFSKLVREAYTETGRFQRTITMMPGQLSNTARALTMVGGAIAGLGLVAGGIYVSDILQNSFARMMGRYAAKNPNSIWSNFFDMALFGTMGTDAAGEWAVGFAKGIAENKLTMQKGIEDAVNTLNLSGVFKDSVSTQGKEIWSESELERRAKEAAESLKSPWQKVLDELSDSLRGISEMEKLIGKNLNVERYEAFWGAIEEGIKKLGKSASDPGIQTLIDRLKQVRGEVQGIVQGLPRLNNLPTSLLPSGGLPDLGAENVERIFDSQKLDSSITKYYKGLRKLPSLANAVREGMATEEQALMSLTRDIGIEPAKQIWRNFADEMRKGAIVITDVMHDMRATIVSGFSETFAGIMAGENPFKVLANSLIIPLTEVMRQFGELLIAAGTARESMKVLALTGVGAILAGGALIATSTAVRSFMQKRLTSLAEGGIATGPTAAVVGDNPRSPELITPLHKLPELMRSIMGTAGGPVIRIQGDMAIDGNRLTYFIDEQLQLRKSLSMY